MDMDTDIWTIMFTPTAEAMLAAIKDRRIQTQIVSRIERLTTAPKTQGKPLAGELADCFSIRAVKERYRVVYRLIAQTVVVQIIAVGIRKEGDRNDIYRLAQKLAARGLLFSDAPIDDRKSDDNDTKG